MGDSLWVYTFKAVVILNPCDSMLSEYGLGNANNYYYMQTSESIVKNISIKYTEAKAIKLLQCNVLITKS